MPIFFLFKVSTDPCKDTVFFPVSLRKMEKRNIPKKSQLNITHNETSLEYSMQPPLQTNLCARKQTARLETGNWKRSLHFYWAFPPCQTTRLCVAILMGDREPTTKPSLYGYPSVKLHQPAEQKHWGGASVQKLPSTIAAAVTVGQ